MSFVRLPYRLASSYHDLAFSFTAYLRILFSAFPSHLKHWVLRGVELVPSEQVAN